MDVEDYKTTMAVGLPYSESIADHKPMHEANAESIKTQAINAGFRPAGEVELVGVEPNPESDQSTLLHYSLPVHPKDAAPVNWAGTGSVEESTEELEPDIDIEADGEAGNEADGADAGQGEEQAESE
jgi:hypothetical protein